MSTDATTAVRPDDDRRMVLVLDREAPSVVLARTWVGAHLHHRDVPASVCRDVELIVSELVTNALRHGLGRVVVRLDLSDATCVGVSVTDSGGGEPTVLAPDPNRIGGIGLRIVAEVSDNWGVARFPGGTTVWATVRAA
jgi:anti-sigma regulatory factor (Ser/Thr protein kinase)